MSTIALPARSDVPLEHTWDIASVYADAAAWETAAKELTTRIDRAREFSGRLHEGPATLVAWLELYQELGRAVSTLSMYAHLDSVVDTNDQAATARVGKAGGLVSRFLAAVAFAEPELVTIGFPTLHVWLEQDVRLAPYRHYIQKLERRAAHLRSGEVEELLGEVRDSFQTAGQIHSVLTNADLTFQPAHSAADPAPLPASLEIAQGTISALLTSPDRTVRRTAWEHYADAHLDYKNTMAACMLAGVKQNVFMARARRYPSALDAALDPHRIPTRVFHNLIATFQRNLPTWHRYWRLRREALGLDELHEYDIKAPLADPIRVPYEQAVAWIAEGMAPLGDDYVRILRQGATTDRWVDIYPNRGKGAGAFSYGEQGTYPFIFMSYTDDLFSMSTLAHELGHSLHSYYTWRTQPHIYADYSLFVAEVASNFNQALVRAHLFATHTERNFQLALIEEAMANFHRYLFIMPTLARFELAIHQQVEQGESFNADGLINLMADLFAEGYGDQVVMDRARTGSTWAQFSSHLYANFYVYQYATGIAAANALARTILDGEPGAVERYLTFLSAGGSVDPLDALQQAGVDLSRPEPVEAGFTELARLVDRLESLVA